MGFERNLIEPCWYSLFHDGHCVAPVLVEVDDFIVAATPAHYEALRKSMTERFHFGKWEKGEAEYAGRHIPRPDTSRSRSTQYNFPRDGEDSTASL